MAHKLLPTFLGWQPMTKTAILNLTDWTRWTQALTTQFNNGKFKPFDIEVKEIKDSVSRRQQAYIYGVVYPYLKQGLLDCGYEVKTLTDEQFDYFMRQMFYFDIVPTKKGEVKVPKRLCFTKAHKDEVTGYIEDLLAFGAKIGCYIPSPTN